MNGGRARIEVALAGNPNTGKTTLFNALTGGRARVGNYPGVTVERRSGAHAGPGRSWQVRDLPGCYSLTAHSPEEEIAHHALTGMYGQPPPDVVIVVLDAANLARNLLLLLQIAELGRPVVAALNMIDAAAARGLRIDIAGLAADLGCPVVPLVARTGQGLRALEAAVERVAADPGEGRVVPTAWPEDVQQAIGEARAVLGEITADRPDGEVLWWLSCAPEVARRRRPGLDAALGRIPPPGPLERDLLRRVTTARYARIDRIVGARLRRDPRTGGPDWTARIDAVALHPVSGLALFLLAMGALFQAVFAASDPMISAIDGAFALLGAAARGALPAGLFTDVLVDGLLAGVAGTLVFVPQIVILFMGIALLEDSGYLARTVFLLDRVMLRAGLPGKSFVPLLSAFACNVPGIMATRTISDPKDRLLTILITPLITCAARLPVYTMITAAVFAGSAPVLGFLSLGGLFITAMVLFGVALALLAAFALRPIIGGGTSALLLEMPPYRLPRLRSVLRTVAAQARHFVVQTGTVIVALTVVLWGLMTFPRAELPPPQQEARRAGLCAEGRQAHEECRRAIAGIERRRARDQLRGSLAGRIGRAIEPAIAPLGFDWRIGIGLVGSLAAREVLIPVMGQVYGRGAPQGDDDAYRDEVGRSMVRFSGMTPLVGVSLMVFFAVAMQCLSTLAAIRQETRSWRWPLFALVYLNALAWLLSATVYQLGGALGLA